MKQLKVILVLIAFSLLYAGKSYCQAYCNGGARSGACYANGTDLFAGDIWLMTCPTGNFQYYMEAVGSNSSYGEVNLWGDITSKYVMSSGTTYVYDQGTVSNLDPNNSYWVEVIARTSGTALASVSVTTW